MISNAMKYSPIGGKVTRGNLAAATISVVAGDGKWLSEKNKTVVCMFNPFEYSVSKSNTYKEENAPEKAAVNGTFSSGGAQKLSLNLFFDTYEADQDVSEITRILWGFMEPEPGRKNGKTNADPPPEVIFEWGSFAFRAHIEQMTQKFTLFNEKGIPVRAEISISFIQFGNIDDYRSASFFGQNPTSGNGPAQRRWVVQAGDRIEGIAQNIYGKATHWRKIADFNRLRDVRALTPGEVLLIPEL
ncbi:MAG: peptidoglycan-binding protein [Chloroflexota bacterium]